MDKKAHNVEVLNIDESYLHLMVDGQPYRFRWVDCSQRLAAATQTERANLEVSPSGYGIHWPLVDEDLAITPLLKQAEEELDLAANR
jgi:hypothetical protein